VTRRETWILRGFAVWVTYEWVTLLWNVWHDHAAGQGLGFKLVHTVLAVITIAFAAVACRQHHPQPPPPRPRAPLGPWGGRRSPAGCLPWAPGLCRRPLPG
jgi:hypothetical protein